MKFLRGISRWLVVIEILLTGWQLAPVQAAVVDRIVAILNDDLLLLSEVREHSMRPVAQLVANLQATPDREDALLPYMIERRLLAHEVQYLATPREIDVPRELAVRYIVNAYHYQDRPAFSRAAQAAGISASDLDDELLLYMKGMDYIRRLYRFRENIDDADRVLVLFTDWLTALKAQAALQLVD